MNQSCLTKKMLMEQISQCEFILIDINLYLDTHPDDARALSDYNCYAAQLESLKALFAERFGPIENFGNAKNKSETEWLWSTQAFPWQKTYLEE